MARTKEFDKEQVLDRAMHLFWQKGYHATSVQDLVEGLGISRSSMYDTFGDKDSLFSAALSRYVGGFDPLPLGADAGLRANLRALLMAVASGVPAGPAAPGNCMKGCFLVNTAVELAPERPEVRARMAENLQSFVARFVPLFQAARHEGTIAPHFHPEVAAQLLFTLMEGLAVQSRAGIPAATLARQVDQLEAMIFA
ncbi:MAG: TetR/AcrR family transcriptional regulator [Bacteroidetes bacterium]|nr:TetR/AcrR family transcriptional regulator [Bacteroidota bacterium]